MKSYKYWRRYDLATLAHDITKTQPYLPQMHNIAIQGNRQSIIDALMRRYPTGIPYVDFHSYLHFPILIVLAATNFQVDRPHERHFDAARVSECLLLDTHLLSLVLVSSRDACQVPLRLTSSIFHSCPKGTSGKTTAKSPTQATVQAQARPKTRGQDTCAQVIAHSS